MEIGRMDPFTVNYTSLEAVRTSEITSADRPLSVRNRCVIERIVDVFI